MNGYIRPEIERPKIESVDNANFANAAEKLSAKQNETATEPSNVLPQLDPLAGVQTDIGANVFSDQQIILAKVEKILAQDMDNIFLSLDAGQQAEFKKKGEEVSRQISKLLTKGKAPLKKIVNLIITWLRVIPHVNRFYLEQEAKIKADKIMKLTIKP